MFDLDQCQKFPRDHSYRTCHVRSGHDSAEGKENDFLGAHNNISCCESESEFQNEARSEEDFGGYSPLSWETDPLRMRNIKEETSPLLPHNHHYSNPCPTLRRHALVPSQKELMERIQDMPKSCYELSPRDIVDEQQGLQGKQDESDGEEKGFNFHTEPQTRKQNSKKMKNNNTTGKISRTSSMEKEAFLIKMFIPTFLGPKTKAKQPGNCSKVSPRPSLGRTENHKDRFFLSQVSRNSHTSCSTGSTSESDSSTTRYLIDSITKFNSYSSEGGSSTSPEYKIKHAPHTILNAQN